MLVTRAARTVIAGDLRGAVDKAVRQYRFGYPFCRFTIFPPGKRRQMNATYRLSLSTAITWNRNSAPMSAI